LEFVLFGGAPICRSRFAAPIRAENGLQVSKNETMNVQLLVTPEGSSRAMADLAKPFLPSRKCHLPAFVLHYYLFKFERKQNREGYAQEFVVSIPITIRHGTGFFH
jgi:hypothetical protein